MTRADKRREDCREEIHAFLDTAQEIDQLASHETDRPYEPVHQMWARYHRLAVISSAQLQRPLRGFADALNKVCWEGTPNKEEVWKYLEGPRDQFNRAANAELAADEAPIEHSSLI